MQTILHRHTSERKTPVNIKKEDLGLFAHEFSKEIKATTLLTLKNVYVLKDSIFSLRKFRFYFSYSQLFKLSKKLILKRFLLLFANGEKINKAVWIIDNWSSAYFHWITDALPRLVAAEKFIEGHVVILPAEFVRYNYVKESLGSLKYDVHFYDQKILVSELLLPSHTAPNGNYNKELMHRLRDRFLKQDNVKPYRRIFISRSKANKRRIKNENEIIGLLSSYGYEIHCFEDYTFKEQLEIMEKTEILVGLHGAGLTNMLFMPEKGKVLELRIKNDSHNNCYFSLASDLNHSYYYQLNEGDSIDAHVADVTVDLLELKRNLDILKD